MTAEELLRGLREFALLDPAAARSLERRLHDAEQENRDLRRLIDRRAIGNDPLTQQLRERAEQAERSNAELRGMLEQSKNTMIAVIVGKPVRDLDEQIVAIDAALAQGKP